MKIRKILPHIFLLGIALLLPQICFAQILDSNGIILPEVIDIFRQYRPLINEKKGEIIQKRKISTDQIDNILNANTSVCDISLEHLNDIAQVVFLRPANLERKDTLIHAAKYIPYTNDRVADLFRTIGDIEDVYPKKEHYKYILINGSTVQNMRYRLQTLIHFLELAKLQITPETEIVFLTGERDLFPEENEQQLVATTPLKINPLWIQPIQLPLTEDQAAEWIWNQTQLPEGLRKAKITFVRAKKTEFTNSETKVVTKKRPTTFDTIETWVKEFTPKPGECLSISSQPYIYYQEATIRGFFDKMGLIEKGFTIEGSGNRSDDMTSSQDSFKENIPVILDNFARTIYTEVSNRDAK